MVITEAGKVDLIAQSYGLRGMWYDTPMKLWYERIEATIQFKLIAI